MRRTSVILDAYLDFGCDGEQYFTTTEGTVQLEQLVPPEAVRDGPTKRGRFVITVDYEPNEEVTR